MYVVNVFWSSLVWHIQRKMHYVGGKNIIVQPTPLVKNIYILLDVCFLIKTVNLLTSTVNKRKLRKI